MARRNEVDEFGLSGDAEEREESPFLRQRKAVAVRKSRFSGRLRRMAFWAACALVALMPVGAGGLLLGRYVLQSPRFQLNSPDDVEVRGNQYARRDEILNVLGVTSSPDFPSEMNVFSLSLAAMQKRVESLAWVKSATVGRTFPDRLLVCVTERTPIAYADIGGRIQLIDADGVILDKPDKGAFDFPVVEGLSSLMGADGREARLELYRQFEREVSAELPRSGWMVSQIDLSEPDDLQALLVQGNRTILIHFGREDFAGRFQNFVTLLPALAKSPAPINSIDLRYGNQVVVDPASDLKAQAGPAQEVRKGH